MKNEIIIASNNIGKITEIQQIIGSQFKLITLKEIGIFEDIPEPFFTFEENAKAKAEYVFQATGRDCIAEDSGIVVEALDGAPGVLSARYSGIHGDDQANNEKLLVELKNKSDRSAYYQCVICCCLKGVYFYFSGKCLGTIAEHPMGNGGFGYDPLFIPNGYTESFGMLDSSIKNQISHRSKALAALNKFWQTKK